MLVHPIVVTVSLRDTYSSPEDPCHQVIVKLSGSPTQELIEATLAYRHYDLRRFEVVSWSNSLYSPN